MNIIKIFKEYRTRDPVKHCNVYRTVGCAHVDGMLCDMRTCTITVQVEVKPQYVAEGNQELAQRLSDACEGELEGIVVDIETAKRILDYVLK